MPREGHPRHGVQPLREHGRAHDERGAGGQGRGAEGGHPCGGAAELEWWVPLFFLFFLFSLFLSFPFSGVSVGSGLRRVAYPGLAC